MTIISRPHGFIFLKSHKTASSSVEEFLIRHTPLGDIYRTSKEIVNTGLPRERKGLLLPRLRSPLALSEPRVVSVLRQPVARVSHRLGHAFKLRQHSTATELRALSGSVFFDKAIKATTVRNPWDALVSYFRWQHSGRKGSNPAYAVDWDTFFDAAMGLCLRSERNHYRIRLAYPYLLGDYLFAQGIFCVDELLAFEDLDGSLHRLGQRMGLHFPGFTSKNIHSKKTASSGIDYRAYYSDLQAEKVAEVFSPMLEVCWYRFDAVGTPPEIALPMGSEATGL